MEKELQFQSNQEKHKIEIRGDEGLNTEPFNLENLSPISRRKFLALLAASSAVTLVACNDYHDKGAIVPYNKKPEDITLGIPNYYASTCDGCKSHCGILVKTREGRPIKIDGNPDDFSTGGKICATGQANILNLYDPERLKNPYKNVNGIKNPISWAEADQQIISELKTAVSENKEIAFISNSIYSPTLRNLLNEFKNSYPTVKEYFYDVFNDQTLVDAYNLCYGTSIPTINFENAKVILSFESDFLGNDDRAIKNIKSFVSTKDFISKKEGSRLYVVEGGLSITGAIADYRIKLRPDFIYELVLAILNELVLVRKISSLNSNVTNQISKYNLNDVIKKYNINQNIIKTLINDLIKYRGESAIFGSGNLDLKTNIAILLLNSVLNNENIFNKELFINTFNTLSKPDEIKELVKKIDNKQVGVVIHFGCNPVYELSPEYHYIDSLKKVKTVVTLALSENETTSKSNYVLALSHTLESWGDYSTRSGVYNLQQPVINPLYQTRQKEAILLCWKSGVTINDNLRVDEMYMNYMKDYWEKEIYRNSNVKSSFGDFWLACLHDGFYYLPNNQKREFKFNENALTYLAEEQKAKAKYLLQIKNNSHLKGGKFANNGWLQELPHPITKVVWDNYASLSKKTANELGVRQNDLIEIDNGANKDKYPVYIQDGQADGLIIVEAGYGRKDSGIIADAVGLNSYKFIKPNEKENYLFIECSLQKASGTYKLVTTQEKHSLDDEFLKDLALKRNIIKETTLKKYQTEEKPIHRESEHFKSFYKANQYKDVKWAMAIDLNKCVGCNACIVSCNVENNVPVVGKEQVDKGREMMWMRIDRYYSGNEDNLKVHLQPMLCQHCDFAPCENVCPVVATTHSPDGLNQMTYNRCVGTRYCSNNCPYKVRRFNFLNFRDNFNESYYTKEPVNLMMNPEVTIRSRGVMEKCTFCIQRIADARQKALEAGRKFDGSEVVTACQQACPANAIVFGNMLDENSEVSKLRNHKLAYSVLEELNINPNVTYLAKLRNIESEEKE